MNRKRPQTKCLIDDRIDARCGSIRLPAEFNRRRLAAKRCGITFKKKTLTINIQQKKRETTFFLY